MAEAPDQGRKSALLIGINKYDPWWTNLRGALIDVATTERFLTEVAGISNSNITKLISPPASPNDPLPTLANIESEFQRLARDAQPGDFIYIHYSGHGTRLPTAFRGLKGENVLFDESLVLPGSDKKLDYLRDVEIAFLLKQIADKGATVTLVLDCCHSGGATRGDDDDGDWVRGSDDIPEERFYDLNRKPIQPMDDLEDAWSPPPDDGDGGRGGSVVQHWMTASKGINFFAACQPKQKAQEVPRKAEVRRGLFTDCLASVIKAQSGANGGPGRLHQLSCDVVSNLVSHRLQNHTQKSSSWEQDMVFGGQGDCHIFGVETVEQPAAVVTSVEPLTKGKLKVGLTAGVAHGVWVDDVFAIYPSGRLFNTLADYTAPLATCSVTAVEDFECEAHIQSDAANPDQVKVGCTAVSLRSILKDHVLQPKGVWVSAAEDGAGLSNPAVQNVRDYISRESKLVELEEAPEEAFFKVLVQEDGSSTICFTPNQAEAKVQVTGEPEDVLCHLVHLTIFYNLFNLAKDNAVRQEQGLTVSKIGYLDQGVEPPEPHRTQLDPPCNLKAFPQDSIDIPTGQSIGIEVHNTSWEDVYVEILDLEPSWQVTRTYPQKKRAPILVPPNEGTRFFIEMSLSDKVRNVVQPDTFDRFIVLATFRDRKNFPEKILPMLGKKGEPTLSVLEPDDGGRTGRGVGRPAWFVQQLDIRVVAEESIEGSEKFNATASEGTA